MRWSICPGMPQKRYGHTKQITSLNLLIVSISRFQTVWQKYDSSRGVPDGVGGSGPDPRTFENPSSRPLQIRE